MKTVLCPNCFQSLIKMTGKDDVVSCNNCGFLQLDFTTVKFQSSEWNPCGKAHVLADNAEYQQKMLEQSRKDESDRFMDNWGCR